MPIKKIDFLDVPLHILAPEEIEAVVLSLLQKDKPQYVMFLSFLDILRARRPGHFRDVVLNAALCLPTSASILRGARFLRLSEPIRYQSFPFIIRLLNVIEEHFKSLYLFGGHQNSLLIAERNVKATFPNIRFLGRFPGFYHKDLEPKIVAAIAKASPSLTILSAGVSKNIKLVYANRNRLNAGIFLYDKNVIDIFAARKQRTPEHIFKRGHEMLHEATRNPIKLLAVFPYIWYNILLIYYKLFKKTSKQIRE